MTDQSMEVSSSDINLKLGKRTHVALQRHFHDAFTSV